MRSIDQKATLVPLPSRLGLSCSIGLDQIVQGASLVDESLSRIWMSLVIKHLKLEPDGLVRVGQIILHPAIAAPTDFPLPSQLEIQVGFGCHEISAAAGLLVPQGAIDSAPTFCGEGRRAKRYPTCGAAPVK